MSEKATNPKKWELPETEIARIEAETGMTTHPEIQKISNEQATRVKAKAIGSIARSLAMRAGNLSPQQREQSGVYVADSDRIGSLGHGGRVLTTTEKDDDGYVKTNTSTIVHNATANSGKIVDGSSVLTDSNAHFATRYSKTHNGEEVANTHHRVASSPDGARYSSFVDGTASTSTYSGSGGGPVDERMASRQAVNILQSQKDVIVAAEQSVPAVEQPPIDQAA